jgi:hypothetical protein
MNLLSTYLHMFYHNTHKLINNSACKLRVRSSMCHPHSFQISTSEDRVRQLRIRISVQVVRGWQRGGN